jgi:putative ABC transport system permease protein
MHKWLQHFEFHVSVPWWIFIVVGGVAIVIAVVTISLQSIKAALSNPVKSLNRE